MSEKVKDIDEWGYLHNYLKKNGCEVEWHSWCSIREQHRKAEAETAKLRARVEEMEREIEYRQDLDDASSENIKNDLDNACMSFFHGFGLLSDSEKENMRHTAKLWAKAFTDAYEATAKAKRGQE